MKHISLVLLVIGVVVTGIFLPYIPGDYDYFAVGLSNIFQFAAFASLLLVFVGLFWLIKDFIKNKRNNVPSIHAVYFRRITLTIVVIIILAAALGAFVTHNRFSAIIILISGIYVFTKIRKKLYLQNATNPGVIPYYFFIIPLAVFAIRMTYLEKAKNYTTDFVIKQSEQLIQDIEAYKKTNGYYPVSLQSTIEDYKPSVSGIDRFHYEPNGNAYNIYFEQVSDIIGTQEIVMYNKLDEHEMTVHNQDLLRIAPGNIFRGYHKVAELSNPHWKVFYFD